MILSNHHLLTGKIPCEYNKRIVLELYAVKDCDRDHTPNGKNRPEADIKAVRIFEGIVKWM